LQDVFTERLSQQGLNEAVVLLFSNNKRF
jgi:hypothetical protein